MLVSFLAYFSSLEMKATYSSGTSVDFQRTARRYIPKDRTLHNRSCDNLKSYMAELGSIEVDEKTQGRPTQKLKYISCTRTIAEAFV
jgi:hypothetical protein